VLPVLGAYRLDQIRPRDVQKFVEGLVKADMPPATIDAALTPLAVVPEEVVHPVLLGGWWFSKPQFQGVPDEAAR
jgi:hypothetical protein